MYIGEGKNEIGRSILRKVKGVKNGLSVEKTKEELRLWHRRGYYILFLWDFSYLSWSFMDGMMYAALGVACMTYVDTFVYGFL